jgi:phage terminase large subunit-like protein
MIDVSTVNRAFEYVEDVLEERIVAGKYLKLACERFVNDLHKAQEPDEDFPWVFDVELAARYVQFIETVCVHSRGSWAGKPFILSPWQVFFVAQVFGWVHKDDQELRRFTTAHLFVARKSGKSQLAAAITLAMSILDKDGAPQLVSAATKRDQAREVFDEVTRCIKLSPALKKRFNVTRTEVFGPRMGVIKPLASDANSLDGLNLNLAVVDEFHAMKNGDLYRVLASSMGSRKSPLMLAITTAGFIPDGPCANFMSQGKKVLEGSKENHRLLVLLYEIDDVDKWDDPEELKKANPGMGTSITEEFLLQQAKNARLYGGQTVVEFKVKHCNLFMGSADVWITDEAWMSEDNLIEPPRGSINKKTKKPEAYMGLDLASTDDITALAILTGDSEDGWGVKMHYFLPEAAVEKRLAKDETTVYGRFSELENVHITPGNVTDYSAIRRLITGKYMDGGRLVQDEDCLMAKYHIKALAYDRWNSLGLITDLEDDGVPTDPFGQGFGDMSFPSKEFEMAVLKGHMAHGGDEVLRWMLGNIHLRIDPAGNIKPDKAKSGDKIDGVVAAIMAMGEALTYEAPAPDFEFFLAVVGGS